MEEYVLFRAGSTKVMKPSEDDLLVCGYADGGSHGFKPSQMTSCPNAMWPSPNPCVFFI